MESTKETPNPLTAKTETSPIPAVRVEETAILVHDALRRALQLHLKPGELFYPVEEPAQESGSTLRDYLYVLFRNKMIICVALAAVMLTTLLGLSLQTPAYVAQTKMLISGEKQVEAPYYREINGYRNVPIVLTQSEIVTSYPVIKKAVRALGLAGRPEDEASTANFWKRKWLEFRNRDLRARIAALTPEQRAFFMNRQAEESLRTSIKVQPIRDTQLFTIQVTAPNPLEAARRANVVSRSYVIFDIEQQLAELQLKYGEKHPAIIELRDNIERMSRDLNGLEVASLDAIGPASVKIIEQARPPLAAEGLPHGVILFAAGVIGLLLAVILAFAFDALDTSLKSPQDIENFVHMPFLGSISRKGFGEKLLIREGGRSSVYTRSCQAVADQIFLVMKNKNLRMLMLSSFLPDEGAAAITANLGIYFARKMDQKVLLVNANLRNPILQKYFNLDERPGLADVLEGKIAFEKAVQHVDCNLSVLPAGITTHNPMTLLDSPSMAELVKTARDRFDIVLFDCADLKNHRDAYFLSAAVDGTVLVVEERRTKRALVKRALAPWEQMNANVLGAILNNRTFPIPEMLYGRV